MEAFNPRSHRTQRQFAGPTDKAISVAAQRVCYVYNVTKYDKSWHAEMRDFVQVSRSFALPRTRACVGEGIRKTTQAKLEIIAGLLA
jgi:hypothetical protein